MTEREIFFAALEMTTPEARAGYLLGACHGDLPLRRKVDDLLKEHFSNDSLLAEPSGEGEQPTLKHDRPPEEAPAQMLGRYKLLEKIGEGGFGEVWMAEQREPIKRRVALKIIKLGMDSRQIVNRFAVERQALAMMDHANIAKIFDADVTDTGRPYFVMELVRGIKITEYCDQNQLPNRERLRLFILVCQAIQHAHQKGIIHRDIKPSNILVTLHDGVAVPKVIDFGIAKATQQELTDQTVFTQFQQFIGTPAYISPEQAEMSGLDIDTRADIYSLGVLLYELLVSQTPFDAREMMQGGLDALRQIIREKEPLRPSTKLNTLAGEARITAGKRRQTEVGKLVHELQGDLDWIVMKCLEKDRARRYDTANGLAMDIQRHLSHEPVLARPPSGMYLLQKLAQRNRGALIAATTVLLALLLAVLTLATSNARIRQERNQKDHALRERGTALEVARASEHQAREQLFVSLQSQAQARRNSRQMGQRLESLAALAEAARIRPTPELRDNAIAAMAIPDVERGPVWQAGAADTKVIAYDTLYQRCARMGQDGTISIRTIPDDRELQRLESKPLARTDVARGQLMFSPDDRFIARLDENGTLSVWRWERGELVLKSFPGKGSALAFTPDSRRVAVGQENWIICFDLSTGEESRRWQTRDRAHMMSFHPDSRRLAATYYNANVVSIYNADDGEHVADLPTGASSWTIVAWHPDGNLLATAGSDPRIQIWDVKAQHKVAALEGHVQPVTSLVFHSGVDLLTSSSWDGVVRLWEPSPGRLLMRLPLSSAWFGLGRESRWAGVISPSNHQAQLWGIVPSQEYHTFLNTFRDGASTSAEGDISPDGTLLALGASDGVRLWDVARGREVAWLRLDDTTAALFRADGRELLTCGDDGLRRWGMVTNTEPQGGLELGPSHRIALPFVPRRMAKGRDDRTLAVVGEYAGQCVILDLVTESVRVAQMPHAKAGYVAVSPDAERLATSGWHSDRVKVWDGPSGKLIKDLEVGLSSPVFFTPDNREMIVARALEFTFHDLNSLEVSRRMPREVGLYPGHVAFTADGKLMALEMAPGLIHLKEITSGRTVAKLEDPQGDHSTWMSFTPDGTQLVVAARYAGAIHRWDLRAIRTRLKTMNLDWDWPEFSAPPPGETSFSKNHRPLRVQVVGARPTVAIPASVTNASPAQP